MEISAHYERQPKASLIAIEELLQDDLYYRRVEAAEDDVTNVEE
jgi:hypothetical protein